MFVVRGLLVQAGRTGLALSGPLRYASFGIDTVLLLAGLLLLAVLPAAVFANGWLLVKLLLLPVYVLLGWIALHRARGRINRLAFFAAALLAYLSMYSIARAHHPLGWLRAWFGG